jgi:hypothetical protein
VGQIPDAKPILVLDHIPKHEPEGVPLHHLIESGLTGPGKVGREEEPIAGIFSKDPNPSHPEQPLHGRRVFY